MIETAPLLEAEEKTPNQRAQTWLREFEDALTRSDVAATVRLFVEQSYWRDLVSFTWNITTLEGRDGIGAMLEANLARVKPSSFVLEGEAATADGITEAWFTFETAVARGKGLVRLKDAGAWTLLTTITELKGFEEKQGATREKGAGARRAAWPQELARTQSR